MFEGFISFMLTDDSWTANVEMLVGFVTYDNVPETINNQIFDLTFYYVLSTLLFSFEYKTVLTLCECLTHVCWSGAACPQSTVHRRQRPTAPHCDGRDDATRRSGKVHSDPQNHRQYDTTRMTSFLFSHSCRTSEVDEFDGQTSSRALELCFFKYSSSPPPNLLVELVLWQKKVVTLHL